MAKVLGISCYYHDSAAAFLRDGQIVAAAEEERFSRRKHDTSFPFHAIKFCLGQGQTLLEEVDAVAFYEKPLVKFQRVLQTHAEWFPRSLPAFLKTMPDWLGRKLLIPHLLRLIIGPDHRVLVPACMLGGGAYVVLCDILARTLPEQGEMPAGVITAMIGAPLFIILLKKSGS